MSVTTAQASGVIAKEAQVYTYYSPTPTPLVEPAINKLGLDIVSGAIPPGTSFTLSDLSERFSVSRTVAREIMRGMELLGMVVTARRVGLTVTSPEHWNVLDEKIIMWRLAAKNSRNEALRNLTQLRIAIEPSAAQLAAVNASHQDRENLLTMAHKMNMLGEAGRGHTQSFLSADIDFHRTILVSSGNDLFAALAYTIQTVLEGRQRLGLQPKNPHPERLRLHIDVARAIANCDLDNLPGLMTALIADADDMIDAIDNKTNQTAQAAH